MILEMKSSNVLQSNYITKRALEAWVGEIEKGIDWGTTNEMKNESNKLTWRNQEAKGRIWN